VPPRLPSGILEWEDDIQVEAARRELALRWQRTLEMYRDGLCDRSFRDKSLAAISEKEGRCELQLNPSLDIRPLGGTVDGGWLKRRNPQVRGE